MAKLQEMEEWNNKPIVEGIDIRRKNKNPMQAGMDVLAMYNSRNIYHPAPQESPSQQEI